MLEQQPFDIDRAIALVRQAVKPLPKAALFELAAAGHRSPFEQLVACIISIRTRDETTLPVALRLFQQASTPAAISQLPVEVLDQLISESTYHEVKARQIHAIATQVVAHHQGILPCDIDTLLSFSGVGPKCAHLVLGIACHQPCISVDVHVDRVTNRWGYVQTRTPGATEAALTAKLPRAYWIEINELLVPFGKHICTGKLPHCSTCLVQNLCAQVGVKSHR